MIVKSSVSTCKYCAGLPGFARNIGWLKKNPDIGKVLFSFVQAFNCRFFLYCSMVLVCYSPVLLAVVVRFVSHKIGGITSSPHKSPKTHPQKISRCFYGFDTPAPPNLKLVPLANQGFRAHAVNLCLPSHLSNSCANCAHPFTAGWAGQGVVAHKFPDTLIGHEVRA